jgi:hypothetical protein
MRSLGASGGREMIQRKLGLRVAARDPEESRTTKLMVKSYGEAANIQV